ncbi:adenylate/guanylate cyclase domain-containing protein [Thalassospira sp. HF15]|uniref:adenylate/guanylate cyclase domain-containing protein n=1 Tax=Thalassospira sp. HF15 TaxID=2722755 RepID=UPI0014314CDC|nr:adenylate/guanylate cyclase domain-containing protein [Thalassospira sp. HF15]NIY74145.1 adenylate/guanylate cyclase domain-containing protein [Thalassospira sp. HF15]
MWNNAPVIDWIASTGRLLEDPNAFFNGLMEQLNTNGFHIARMRCSMQALHPQVAVWSFTWDRDQGAHLWEANHGIHESGAYIGSPVEEVNLHGGPVRIQLAKVDPADHHPLVGELVEMGLTDYYCTRVRFSGGRWCVMTIATDQSGGFEDGEITCFDGLLDHIGVVLELHVTKRIEHSLLDTYLGERTGARVMHGQMRRGDGETIRAALWFSDVRDFTVLTETLSVEQLLDSLNVYFETVERAVRAHGGEILRFVGDAMLIVFAQENDQSAETVCENALRAAEAALADLQNVNETRSEAGLPLLRFGVGLHYGEVVYGNVGGTHRLDFTVMGVAVNRTARLESLTKQIGTPLLMSDVLASHIKAATVCCGDFAVKGVSEPLTVHALEAALPFAPADGDKT